MRKQATRRHLAKVRAAFANQPLAMNARVVGQVLQAVEAGDLSAVSAALDFGAADIPATTRVVNGVAIIPLTGTLRDEADWMVRYCGAASYQVVERDLKAALESTQVKAIVLYVNSPGGSALGCKRAGDAIFASRGAKPIVAFCQGMCCSAAYALASACDRIVSTADSLIGSIGTIYTHMEVSGLAKEIGYGFTVLTNKDSPKKGHGNLYEPLTKDARETLQNFVDSYGEPFISDVARNRNVKAEKVKAGYGEGDTFVATEALRRGMIDGIAAGFPAFLESVSAGQAVAIETTETEDDDGEPVPSEAREEPEDQRNARQQPIATREPISTRSVPVKKIKAQLFAMGLLESVEASDELANVALRAFCAAKGLAVPKDEAAQLALLQSGTKAKSEDDDEEDNEEGTIEEEEDVDEEDEEEKMKKTSKRKPAKNIAKAHAREFAEARLAARADFSDLKAAADLVNKGGTVVVTAEMVAEAFEQGLNCKSAIKYWNKQIQAAASPIATTRITPVAVNADQFAADAVSALTFRASNGRGQQPLNDGAANLVQRPLWAIAAECLALSGERVDVYGDRELIAERAMAMGGTARHVFFSSREGRQYISADAGIPYSRPGDFPNILSNLANKFLDTIELDEDYSFERFTAVMPGGLKDFRPTSMVNKGIAEELDVLQDAEQFKELGLSEEILSYIFLQRFGNKWGWTPLMVANDDMGAFAEGMLGLDEAWMVTQNRLCLDLLTGNPTLLDGSALFRTANDVTSGAAPSDAQWAAMELLYADVTGIGTTRRVRGTLNTILVPTGTARQEAVRTFAPLNLVEPKMAATTANVGIYRGDVEIVSDSELRGQAVATRYYGFRSPTNVRTATIVRGYFGGYGTAGRRERWFDPETKTTWVSIEGRVGAAIKNWRYAVRNKGAA